MSTPFDLRPGPPNLDLTPAQRAFERKVALSRLALMLETAWPRLWLLAGIGIAFVCASLMGLWGTLSELVHEIVLGAFGLAALAALVNVLRVPVPARALCIRRIEQRSGVPHRPASTYEDTLSAASADPVVRTIWTAHRARLAAMIGRLRVGTPSPRVETRDPFAIRALGLLATVVLTVLAGDAASDRIAAAFRLSPLAKIAGARLDAWVTPPAYTNAAPLMLADGSRGLAGLSVNGEGPATVPANSTLVVRTSGGLGALSLEVIPDAVVGKPASAPSHVAVPKDAAAGADAELQTPLTSNATVRVLADGRTVATWAFVVTPDMPPKVSFSRQPERTLHGALRIPFHVEDDYGVASVEAHIARLPKSADTSANAWARPARQKGPRPPYEHPPQLAMRLPSTYPKSADGVSLHEIGDSVWAGLPVTLTLVAKDSAGQIGKSEARKMVLPQRQFYKPLAKALIEQRRDLFDDPRQMPHILAALDAITLAPEDNNPNIGVYLGIRSVYWRLQHDGSREARNSAIAQLWNIAVRIEDGALSDAERALKDAQDKLSKALENGATDEEIRQLMQELRQAMNNFLREMMQAQGRQPNDQQNQQMGETYNLDQLMQNLENMARSGNRDQAEQMLSELRELMEQLQSGRMAMQQGGQGQSESNKMMNQLGEILGKEQQLLDDTYRQQQGDDGGQQPMPGQQMPGQRGQRGQGQRQGQNQGQGQPGQQGQQGQTPGQQPGGQAPGGGQGTQRGLGERQQALHDLLDKLQQGLAQHGLDGNQFGDAGKAMKEAEEALRKRDLEDGSAAEQQALDALRKGARQLAEEMMKKGGSRLGSNGRPTGPVDPLGRPQSHADGSDPGTGVKVPDQIDTQRAREILEELRKRLGESNRPAYELDYLERLLKQF